MIQQMWKMWNVESVGFHICVTPSDMGSVLPGNIVSTHPCVTTYIPTPNVEFHIPHSSKRQRPTP